MTKIPRHGEAQPENRPPFSGMDTAGQGQSEPRLAVNKSEIAEYIADMLIPMRQLADEAELKFMTYLLDMAIREASSEMDKN